MGFPGIFSLEAVVANAERNDKLARVLALTAREE
jgi:hypothetical protein